MAGNAEKSSFIEALRGIAIFVVVYYHYANRVPYQYLGADQPPLLPFYSGKIGVYLFFVLSGYLIAQSLERSKGLADFYAKRVSRIWPLFAVACVLIYVFLIFFEPPRVLSGPKEFYSDPVGLKDMIGSIFFLEDFGIRWVDGVFWSILVELKFYLFVGIAAAFFKERYIERFAMIAVVLALLDFGLSFLDGGFVPPIVNRLMHGVLISQYLPYFAIGILFYAQRYGPLLIVSLVLAIAQLLQGVGHNPDFEIEGTIRFFTALAVLLAVDALVLKGRIFLFLGKYSFSLYLFHQMIGLTLIRMMAPTLGYDFAMIVAFVAVMVFSCYASWAFEWRFRRQTSVLLMRAMSVMRLDRIKLTATAVSPAQAAV